MREFRSYGSVEGVMSNHLISTPTFGLKREACILLRGFAFLGRAKGEVSEARHGCEVVQRLFWGTAGGGTKTCQGVALVNAGPKQ